MPPTEIVGPQGQTVTAAQDQAIAKQSAASDLASKAKAAVQTAQQQVNGALVAGWKVMAFAAAGYLLSETRILGPIVAIILALATIYQLNQWEQTRKGA